MDAVAVVEDVGVRLAETLDERARLAEALAVRDRLAAALSEGAELAIALGGAELALSDAAADGEALLTVHAVMMAAPAAPAGLPPPAYATLPGSSATPAEPLKKLLPPPPPPAELGVLPPAPPPPPNQPPPPPPPSLPGSVRAGPPDAQPVPPWA